MTCIVLYPTKKSFRNAVALDPRSVAIEDPSIVAPRSFYAADIQEGEDIFVTNHPKRSWFARVLRRDGRLIVT